MPPRKKVSASKRGGKSGSASSSRRAKSDSPKPGVGGKKYGRPSQNPSKDSTSSQSSPPTRSSPLRRVTTPSASPRDVKNPQDRGPASQPPKPSKQPIKTSYYRFVPGDGRYLMGETAAVSRALGERVARDLSEPGLDSSRKPIEVSCKVRPPFQLPGIDVPGLYDSKDASRTIWMKARNFFSKFSFGRKSRSDQTPRKWRFPAAPEYQRLHHVQRPSTRSFRPVRLGVQLERARMNYIYKKNDEIVQRELGKRKLETARTQNLIGRRPLHWSEHEAQHRIGRPFFSNKASLGQRTQGPRSGGKSVPSSSASNQTERHRNPSAHPPNGEFGVEDSTEQTTLDSPPEQILASQGVKPPRHHTDIPTQPHPVTPDSAEPSTSSSSDPEQDIDALGLYQIISDQDADDDAQLDDTKDEDFISSPTTSDAWEHEMDGSEISEDREGVGDWLNENAGDLLEGELERIERGED